MDLMPIKGKKIYLRKLNRQDASLEYCNWLNDQIVNKYLETRKASISDLKQYIKEKNKNPNCLFLGIFYKKNKKHIGNIKLEPIDFKNKEAVFGILIGNKKYWGKGIGTEATELIVDYAFKQLKLDKITLGVISENKGAIKAYKKAGFKIERTEKKAVRHDKKLFDKIVMSIKKEN